MPESCKTIPIPIHARLEMSPHGDRARSHACSEVFHAGIAASPSTFPFLPGAGAHRPTQCMQCKRREELYSAPGTVSTALKALILQRLEEHAPKLRQLGMHARCEPAATSGGGAGDGTRYLPNTYKRINLPKAKPCRGSRFNSSARIPSRLPIASTIAQC